jgi:streptogramin lyase
LDSGIDCRAMDMQPASPSSATLRAGLAVAGAVAVLAALAIVPAASSAQSCAPVVNPYDGTRYEGVDLSHIRAKGVACPKARRVATRAHKKGLALAPSPDGFLEFRSRGWTVVGDLRPSSDKYFAARNGKRVRWRF